MKWNGGTNQMPFAWNVGYYDLWFFGGHFGINTGNNLLGISSTNLANQWVHVAVVFPNGVPSSSNTKMFINGVQQAFTYQTGTATSRMATSTITLGKSPYGGYQFGGLIDDVRIYNRELMAAEVAALAAP
jgi:hypothetical protein